MQKIFALAIVLGLAACAPKETPAPAVDTTATAPAVDTTAADTTRADSTAPAAPAAQ